MFKKIFLYIITLVTLQLFLSQSIATVVFKFNHSHESSLNSQLSNSYSIEEFNITTHTNLLSINKDENNKEESNLDILGAIAYSLLCGVCYSEYEKISVSCIPHFKFNTLLLPVYIVNKVFRL